MIALVAPYGTLRDHPLPTVTVHADQVARRDADRFFGIDLNYIRDRDSNRPGVRSLDAALAEMGVRWLRFPGGEKSNFHMWADPPYTKPAPRSLGWYATPKGDRMDFDEFIRHARTLHAEPFVVVACASPELTGRTWAQWRESAAAWVRYARAHHDGVRYWEIGNENWSKGMPPAEMGRIVVDFARAMKAVDPGIEVGASGNNDRWWSGFLPVAGPDIDFLTVSEYTGWEWRSYDHFLSYPDLGGAALTAVAAIDKYAAPADRKRLRVIVSETNTKDYAKGGWPDGNDLGHALATFATLGRMVEEPKIAAAMVWTTRWMNDAEAPTTPFYALGPSNEFTPTGDALAAWAHFVLPDLVVTDGGDAFASRSADGRRMTVWLLNRSRSKRAVRLVVDGSVFRPAAAFRFSGAGDTDRHPEFVAVPEPKLDNIELPALSITVLSLRRSP